MRFIAVFVVLMLLAGCHDEPEITGTTLQCAEGLFTSYNPKNLNQCIAVCTRCERGTITTCSTSCRLKGAE